MTLVLCWDIDGTLLTTARAGIFAWEEAATAVTGRSADFASLQTAGLTDVEIARRILDRCGLGGDAGLEAELLRRYERALPGCLGRRAGRVLPGVREVLEALRGRDDVVAILLTGNTAAGAAAKLHHYGLAGYFAHGAFADGAPDRPTIARRAVALVRQLTGTDPSPHRTYVIGDTPHDIHCARAIGARAVAVASGIYGVDELRRHDPWWAIERLPEPDAFLKGLEGVAP